MKEKTTEQTDLWQPLQLFNLYRFILAFGFWMIIKFDVENNFFFVTNIVAFENTTLIYLCASIVFLLLPFITQKHYSLQINLAIFFDIPMILLLMHLCGGIMSGVGILLIVIVAAHSLFVVTKWSLFSAALATIGLILEQSYNVLYFNLSTNLYTQVGLLGTVIILSAFCTNILSTRIRRHQNILYQKELALSLSQQLNSYIIYSMHEGVVILDEQCHIKLMNISAYRLLDLQSKDIIQDIHHLPKNFQDCFYTWKQRKKYPHGNFFFNTHHVRFSFHALGKDLPAGTLAFIYDVTREIQHAQDLKLASLGHLTANIAHELRNPLGAISHAAQLLAESTTFPEPDRELIDIIYQHSNRMNMIIQNILSLSSRKQPNAITINLITWLKEFIHSFASSENIPPDITLICSEDPLSVKLDPTQFAQIMINLCENGLRYSYRHTGKGTLLITLNTRLSPPIVFLDIIDQGPGISDKIAKHIFEPFYTTEKMGSGLGLYLAKELCLFNEIRLELIPEQNKGGHFRLSIPLEEII